MVTELAKWVLVNTKVDPLLVANAWKIPERECWEYILETKEVFNLAEKQRDHAEIAKQAKQFAESLIYSDDQEERDSIYEMRRSILVERLKNAKTEKEKQERLINFKLFTNKLDTLTRQQIDNARAYSLKDLLGTNKNITNCPFHDDRTASFNIKNNFYHCHGCGVSGDTIDFLMERDGLSFREAVLNLT